MQAAANAAADVVEAENEGTLVPTDTNNQPKDPRSRAKYNLFSRIFFFWVDPLFFLGCCHDLKQSDLYAHPKEADSNTLDKQFRLYWKQELQRKHIDKKPRLWMVFAKSFKWQLFLQTILSFLEVAMLIGQTVILGKLVDYFSDVNREQITQCLISAAAVASKGSGDGGDQTNTSASGMGLEENPPATPLSSTDAYLYGLGLSLLAAMVSIVHAHYALIGCKIGMMCRIMSTSAIYRKTMLMSQNTISRITAGHVINVVSNDVQRFDLAFVFMPFLLIAPMHVVVFTYLGYQEVGWVIFPVIFLFILQIPVQLVLAKIFTKFRFKSASVTDKRVHVMNEVITGIRVIKMYAWEYAFKRAVTALRKNEVHLIKIGGMIRTLTASFNFGISLSLFMAITFITYVKTGHDLTPRRVIVVLSLLSILRTVGATFFIRATFLLLEAMVAVTRIQVILEEEEMDPDHKKQRPISTLSKEKKLTDNIMESSFFRSESPFLPGAKRENVVQPSEEEPTQLASITISSRTDSPPNTTVDKGSGVSTHLSDILSPSNPYSEPPSSVEEDSSTSDVVFPALQHNIIVRNLTATWKKEEVNKKDSEKLEKKEEKKDKDAEAEEEAEEEKEVLRNISFEVSRDKPFLAVVGKVASGKSTLLQCLIKELRPLAGTVVVNGRLSYASQLPWVFHATIRNNILFGLPFEQERYEKVVDACALISDFDHLIDGDRTLVGERGVTLSGGQKARVNLARAVYRQADIYLLDDPLSAVDVSVGKHIFNCCIRGLLLHSQVILVTHQVQFAILADQLLILNKGKVQGYHSQAECKRIGLNHHELLKMMKTEGEEFVPECIEEDEEEFDEEDLGLDDEGDGDDSDDCFEPLPTSPVRQASVADLNYQRMLCLEDSLGANRAVLESISSIKLKRIASIPRDDKLIGSMMALHGYIDNISIHSTRSVDLLDADPTSGQDGEQEKNVHGSVSLKTYHEFFLAGAGYIMMAIFLVFYVLGEMGVVLADTWLSKWSSCLPASIAEICNKTVEPICLLTDDERLGAYGGITVASIILNFIRSAIFYLICMNASRVLHNRMFGALIRAPVHFFDTNPSGRILNRFSKDIGFLDDLLPHTFLEYLFLVLKFVGILITASYSSPFILIPSLCIVVFFIAIRSYYLRTSRDIKRLEAIARSPVYSHFSITLQGLSTIRTLCMQNQAHQLLHHYQNEHTQGWYLYLVTQRWFGLRIDLITSIYLGVVVFITVYLAQTVDAGVVGLALAYTISLAGVLQFCVRQSAEVENIMISTERILEYSKLEPEAPLETEPKDKTPPNDWPTKGEIRFSKVKFRYATNLPLAVNKLKLHVHPSEKIGIVGRTGAGKSSLISILFRLGEPEGELRIDDVDIKSIGLHDLRKKMSIIPQDPVLFSGTMRYNLDPLKDYSDEQLWGVLEQVQMKRTVEKIEGKLSGAVSEGGSNFSVGERQLVCLARALLKNNRILILDEATANVDIGTDEIIQKAIRENFQGCTVLTIAHRLNTVMDSDKIMVMSHGYVVEFDTPYELLQRRNGALSRMLDRTGEEASAVLRAMVKQPT